MIDLHSHSNASDGDLSPSELVEAAHKKGIKALALTDHDTIAGLEEAKTAAEKSGLRFIPGVELEINPEAPDFFVPDLVINGEFHLLGLGIQSITKDLTDTLTYLEEERDKRNHLILEKMKEAGINAEYAEIEAFAHGGAGRKEGALPPEGKIIVARPHFGAFLISRKIVRTQQQAFNRYLGKGRPFYVPKKGLSFATAASLIHESGGIAVLAHPMSLYLGWSKLSGLFARLKELGLDGIEAWHPTARVQDCKRLEELARLSNLHVTAGSDFHGSARPERRLGVTAGDRAIEDSFLEAIPELARL